jgi:hypothetical protein
VIKATGWPLTFVVVLASTCGAACTGGSAAVMPRARSTLASYTGELDTLSIGQAVSAWMQRHRAPALSVAIALDG